MYVSVCVLSLQVLGRKKTGTPAGGADEQGAGGGAPGTPDSSLFPKLEKRSRPARILGYGAATKATPDEGSPAVCRRVHGYI